MWKNIQCLMQLLDEMMAWMSEAPLNRRRISGSGTSLFGGTSSSSKGPVCLHDLINLIQKQRLPTLVASFQDIPPALPPQLLPLLLNSYAFGHPIRLDYGTGHELAFVLGLRCCVASGWVGGEEKEDEEDELVLRVFTRLAVSVPGRLRF